MKALLGLAAASILALAACGGASAGATGGTINATLTDTGITIDRSTVPAGNVTFLVKNAGTTTHELVVLKTDAAANAIPADPEEAGKVSEDGSQGETGDMEKGDAKSLTLSLVPGHYVLICNQVGHYAMGMHVAITVTK